MVDLSNLRRVRFRKDIRIEMYIRILLIVMQSTSIPMTRSEESRRTHMCVLLGDGEEQTRFMCWLIQFDRRYVRRAARSLLELAWMIAEGDRVFHSASGMMLCNG